ncbi:YveK family protein [Actinokineospora pegani]|uniref:hypothetical protein n=1 Tax=Actinokineospora pegani TaxID=2654637 RepID=UPI0012EA7AD3|nr:hypothetical protein [Actinokineospora pegani]
MDFWKTLLVLLKRWYVAVPVFVVSLGLAAGVYAATPMHYESTGTLVLTAPTSGPTQVQDKDSGQTNPLLAFQSSLSISALIVVQSINTPEVVKGLGADKSDHKFLLAGGSDTGPFISVTAESADEEGSRRLVTTVLDLVRSELTKRQEALGAAPETFIRVDDVVPPTEPEPMRGGKLRAGGVALVLGLIASLATVYGVESYQTRKRPDEADEDTAADEPTPEPTGGDPAPAPTRGPEHRAPVERGPDPRALPARGDVPPVRRVLPGEPRQTPSPPATPVATGQQPAQAPGPTTPAAAKPPVAGAPPVNGKSPAPSAAPVNGKAAPNGRPVDQPTIRMKPAPPRDRG